MDTSIGKRIDKQLQELQEFSAGGPGVTRLPFTAAARDATDYLRQHMEEMGLKTYRDTSGAVHGLRPGKIPQRIVVGSHYDSVKGGGPYDGIAGVVCAMEAARLLDGQDLQHTLEVVALNDEEGIRFDGAYFSSKALLGHLTVDELKTNRDKDGMSIYEAMQAIGWDPERIGETHWDLNQIRCFLEMHIEQGPVLEQQHCDLAIVDGIVGLLRYEITLHGQANHAGTTPMAMRHDPLAAAAAIITAVETAACQQPGAVATVGFCTVAPNALNTIASQVTFSVDIRSRHQADITAISDKIKAELTRATAQRGVTYDLKTTFAMDPVDMDETLQAYLRQAAEKNGCTHMDLSSGAAHDSQLMALEIPTAMLFVPSHNGMSHCPQEYTPTEYFVKAVHVLADTIRAIDEEID